ncbi:MAG: TRAP transporter small permease [Casimicrobiaceae bacterium]
MAHPRRDGFATLLRRLASIFALLGAAAAMAAAIMTVSSVALRALTGQPLQGDVELTQFAIALSISLCVPWCQLQGANIIVDFFTQNLRASRLRMLDGIGALLMAVMLALLAWRTGVGAVAVHAAGETSMIRALPMWWVYASLAPGLGLAALIALMQASLHLRGLPLDALQGTPATDDAL